MNEKRKFLTNASQLTMSSNEQVADILTKPLSINQFNKLPMKLTMENPR